MLAPSPGLCAASAMLLPAVLSGRLTHTSIVTCYCGSMPDRSRKRPSDVNALAKQVADEATGETPPEQDEGKDPAAVALGRKGGLKGGKARAAKMTAEERAESARKAAKARWFRKLS